MKKYAILLSAACATVLLAEQRPSATVEVGTYSQYIWRGMVITDGPVLQSSSTIDYRGYHLNVFTNTDLDSVNQRRGKVSELDFDAGYSRTFEKATVSAGLIHYTFPNTSVPSTTELYGGVGLAGPLHPSFKVYVDVGAIDGAYATFDVSHTLVLPRLRPNITWAAELSAGLGAGTSGYNTGYFGVSRTGLVDVHPGLALPIAFGKRLRITPRVGYAAVVDSALRKSLVARAHGFYYGLSLAYTF